MLKQLLSFLRRQESILYRSRVKHGMTWLGNQKGVIHLIPLFLILIGIIAGVYLVQHPQIFKPKATSQNVEFLPGECLTTQDGFGVLKCPNVKIRFTSPIDTGQTSDAGFSLVKTAYAYHKAGTEDYYCYGDNISNLSVGHSEKEPYGHNDFWDPCYRKNQTCVWLDADNRGKSDDGTLFKNDAECVDRPTCQNGRWISRDSKKGIHDFGPCPLTLDQKTIRWFCGKDNKIYRKYWVDPTDLSKGTKEVQDSDDCNIGNRKCEEFFNEVVSGGARDDARCVDKAIDVHSETDGRGGTPAPTSQPRATTVSTVESPSGEATVTTCKAKENYQDVLNRTKQAGYQGPFDQASVIAAYNRAACPKGTTPVTPGGGAAGGVPAGCKNDGPSGNVTPAQASCVLNARKDVLPKYVEWGWCGDESNYPKIVNNWMSINNQGEKDQVKSCFEGASGNVSKTTTRFRFAEDPTSLASADWRDYTAENRTVNYTFKDTSLGTKSIFAEFEIKDSQGNISTVKSTQSVKLIREETPGNGTTIPAGSSCDANGPYITDTICGGGFKTYDKCTDNKGQTGTQLCSGLATSFYCEGSTNSNCLSDPARKGNYSCSACPNLKDRMSNGGGSLTASCSVSGGTTVTVNQPVTYHAAAAGGSGSYKYYWAGDLGNSSSVNNELVKTYTTTGYKTGSAIVSSGNDSKNAACPAVNVVGEESTELLCKQDCKKCTTVNTCNYKTYDSCVDDKGNSKSSNNFCQNGAVKFRCYANANYNCASNQPNVYDYLCSACLDTGSNGE